MRTFTKLGKGCISAQGTVWILEMVPKNWVSVSLQCDAALSVDRTKTRDGHFQHFSYKSQSPSGYRV